MSREYSGGERRIADGDLRVCPMILPEYKALRDMVRKHQELRSRASELSVDERVLLETLDVTLRRIGPVTVTLSDTHGNFLRKVYELILVGVLEVTRDQYKTLVDCYQLLQKNLYNSPGKEQRDPDVEQLRTAIRAITDTLNQCFDKVNTHIRIIHIGDTLHDRGPADVLNLLLYALSHEKGLNYKIMYSNHDHELFVAYQKYVEDETQNVFSLGGIGINNDQGFSWRTGTRKIVEARIVSLEYLLGILERAVFPYLKLISAEVVCDHLHIYSHAPIDPELIHDVVDFFIGKKIDRLEYSAPEKYLEEINLIDRYFQDIVAARQFSALNLPKHFLYQIKKEELEYRLNSKKEKEYFPTYPGSFSITDCPSELSFSNFLICEEPLNALFWNRITEISPSEVHPIEIANKTELKYQGAVLDTNGKPQRNKNGSGEVITTQKTMCYLGETVHCRTQLFLPNDAKIRIIFGHTRHSQFKHPCFIGTETDFGKEIAEKGRLNKSNFEAQLIFYHQAQCSLQQILNMHNAIGADKLRIVPRTVIVHPAASNRFSLFGAVSNVASFLLEKCSGSSNKPGPTQ